MLPSERDDSSCVSNELKIFSLGWGMKSHNTCFFFFLIRDIRKQLKVLLPVLVVSDAENFRDSPSRHG